MRKTLKKLSLLGGIILTLTACKENTKDKVITTPEITFQKDGELYFVNAEKDTLKHLEIETARSSYEQQTGLMYRKQMQENRGMLFIYDNETPRPNFYMKNTYIPLDLIYINSNNIVVDINEDAKPLNESPILSQAPAQYVLEINGNKAQAWKISKGDSIILHLK